MDAYRTDAGPDTIRCTGCGERVPRAESSFTTTGDLQCRRCEAKTATSQELDIPAFDASLPDFLRPAKQRWSWGDFAYGIGAPWVLLLVLGGVAQTLASFARGLGMGGWAQSWAYGGSALLWPMLLLGAMFTAWRRGRASFAGGVAASGGIVLVLLLLLALALGAGMSKAL